MKKQLLGICILFFALLFTSCKDLNKPSEVIATLQNGYWKEVERYQYTRIESGKEVKGENLLGAGMMGTSSTFLKFQEGNLLRFYWSNTAIPARYYLDSPFSYNEQEHALYHSKLELSTLSSKTKILELSSLCLVLQTENDSSRFFYKRYYKRIQKADFLQSYSKYEEQTP